MKFPALTTDDRAFLVPSCCLVRTGYAPIHNVRLACRDRMAVGDVENAYRKLLQFGDRHPWPCPNGEWEDSTFVLHDGRHEYVASIMLGRDKLLVAWVEALNHSDAPRNIAVLP